MQQVCDLHTHSLFSDGTATPTELVERSIAAGLSAVALTDHNTVAGLEEFETAVAEFKAAVDKAGLFRWSGFSTGPTLEYMFKVWHERYPARADRK